MDRQDRYLHIGDGPAIAVSEGNTGITPPPLPRFPTTPPATNTNRIPLSSPQTFYHELIDVLCRSGDRLQAPLDAHATSNTGTKAGVVAHRLVSTDQLVSLGPEISATEWPVRVIEMIRGEPSANSTDSGSKAWSLPEGVDVPAAATSTVVTIATSTTTTTAPTTEVGTEVSTDFDTWIYPTVQCGPAGIDHDEQMVLEVLAAMPNGWDVHFASAYLNPSTVLTRALASSGTAANAASAGTKGGRGAATSDFWREEGNSNGLSTGRLELLTAHSDSHGFRGAHGLMGCVPGCYQYITDKLVQRVEAERDTLRNAVYGASHSVPEGAFYPWSMLMYRREGWTFHAKGLWSFQRPWDTRAEAGAGAGVVEMAKITAIGGEGGGEGGTSREAAGAVLGDLGTPPPAHSPSEPCVTIVGSSNYGFRSSSLDLESQLVLITEHPELSRALRGEWEELSEHTVPHAPSGATTPWWAPVLSSALGKLM